MEIKDLFEIYLNPIQTDIKELKDGQKQILEIMQNQARQEIEIINIKKDVDECSSSMKKMKETGNNRLWEVTKLGIASIIGGVIAKIF